MDREGLARVSGPYTAQRGLFRRAFDNMLYFIWVRRSECNLEKDNFHAHSAHLSGDQLIGTVEDCTLNFCFPAELQTHSALPFFGNGDSHVDHWALAGDNSYRPGCKLKP